MLVYLSYKGQDIITNGLWSSPKLCYVFRRNLFKLLFVLQILVKISNTEFYKKFFKLEPWGLVQTEEHRQEQKHRNGEGFSRFSSFSADPLK
jgi:hypothetical protein